MGHRKNPKVLVLVLKVYPGDDGTSVAPSSIASHELFSQGIRDGIAGLPNTHWIDWNYNALPEHQELYQTQHWGHPNCRVDKVLAHAATRVLYDVKFLSRGVRSGSTENSRNKAQSCSDLNPPACESATLCYLDGQRRCADYSPGYQGEAGGFPLKGDWIVVLTCALVCVACTLLAGYMYHSRAAGPPAE